MQVVEEDFEYFPGLEEFIDKEVTYKKGEFTCPVCFEAYTSTKFVTLLPCSHLICHECVLEMFYTSIKLGEVREEELKCPTACGNQLPFQIVTSSKTFISPWSF